MNKPGRTFQAESKGQRPEARKVWLQGEGTVRKLQLLGPTEQLGEEAGQNWWGLVGHEYWDFN